MLLLVLVRPVLSQLGDNAADRRNGQLVPNALGLQPVLVLLRGAQGLVVPAAPWSWSASPSAAMAAATVVTQVAQALDSAAALVPIVLPCHRECASRWHLASSCSCRSPQVGRRFHRLVARMAPLLAPVVMAPRQHPLFHAPRLRHRQQRLGVLASDQVQALAASAVPVVPIGMTAPSLKPCGAVPLRSSARRFTSLAKTTMR